MKVLKAKGAANSTFQHTCKVQIGWQRAQGGSNTATVTLRNTTRTILSLMTNETLRKDGQ